MCHPVIPRRKFLQRLGVSGLMLTPLAAALSGCQESHWPTGMAEIKWDRDTCTRCHMVISDRRFAIELRGGSPDMVFKFDDPGCLVFWMRDKAAIYPWMSESATLLWVADFNSKSRDEMVWLKPQQARYIAKTSPMGYNFAAVGGSVPDSIDFNEMRQITLAKGK